MYVPRIYTFAEAGRTLGVSRQAVSDIVRVRGIETCPVPHNGKARGLTEADLRIIRKALGIPSPTSSRRTISNQP